MCEEEQDVGAVVGRDRFGKSGVGRAGQATYPVRRCIVNFQPHTQPSSLISPPPPPMSTPFPPLPPTFPPAPAAVQQQCLHMWCVGGQQVGVQVQQCGQLAGRHEHHAGGCGTPLQDAAEGPGQRARVQTV